ncbi:MAG: PilZ domain-containing protein [Cyanobacteria bacterium TGS_CYA1]|nr:PilZ domain-containing protein [Cyanobacteria bacterium TGS_CYA1]
MSMLETNSSYKIKFEIAPGEFDIGRATILSKTASQIFLQIKTNQSANKILPAGTKLWFVQDAGISGFAGLWASSVMSSQLVKGKKVLVCGLPKLKPLKQRRKVNRVEVKLPVTVTSDDTNARSRTFETVDLCRSGSKLETKLIQKLGLEPGQMVKSEFQLPEGILKIKAQIIRIESNWLANKSIIALQFIALSKESSDKLDKFLVKLGGQASSQKSSKELQTQVKTGLNSWSAQIKEKKNIAPAAKTRTTLAEMTKPLTKAQSVKAPTQAKKPVTKKRSK